MISRPNTRSADEATQSAPAGAKSQTGILLRTLFAAVVLAVLLGLLGFLFEGKMGLEKTLTKLVMPVGAGWLIVCGVFLQNLVGGRRHATILCGSVCLAFTAMACSPLVELCVRYLETQVENYDPQSAPPLDVLVVLGGGTKQGPTRSEVGQSGDRVLYAAQLFKQGHVKRLITTGDAIQGFGGYRTGPSEQTVEIWTQLGIAPERISTLAGLNTYQEIQSLKQLLQTELKGQRVGLLTSALHLPRALRLAQAQGLTQLIPVAADHNWSGQPRTFPDYLPGSGALDQLARCQHELMARLVHR